MSSRRTWSWLLLAFVVLAVPQTSAGSRPLAWSTANESEVEQLTPTQEEARDFRQLFGLASDHELIVRAESDPSFSSINYGVPLDADEEAELQRRVQVEQQAIPAAEFGQRQATWGGYYIDQQARGEPVFLFTGELDLMRAEIANIMPADVSYRVQLVERPLTALSALKARIVAAAEALATDGIKITHVGTDTVGNTISVSVDGLNSGAIDAIEATFGTGLKFEDRPAAVSDACPVSNCRPLRGGIQMEGVSNNDCTSGFIVRRQFNGGRLSILTAGHCLWVTGGFGSDWGHINGGTYDKFGDSLNHTFYNHSPADVGIIELDTLEQPTTANRLNLNSGSTYSVVAILPDSSQVFGAQACAYGFFSNNSKCVTITDPDQANLSEAGSANYWIDHTKEYGWNLVGGDSGGPIYQVFAPGQRMMLGTHVHSEDGGGAGTGWYSPYYTGRNEYQLQSRGDSYYICTNPACTL